MSNGWTGGQYAMFRAVFGLYLLVYFGQLIPRGTETFSSAGAPADGTASPLLVAFPDVLALLDRPVVASVLLVTATAAAAAFALGRFDRVAAIWMWYVLACLFVRNPLPPYPSLPFVGWLLIAHCFLPRSSLGMFSAGQRDLSRRWALPDRIFLAAWIVMALAYTSSGTAKLISPSWLDGTAMHEVLESPLARDTGLRLLVLALPPLVLKLATWGGLGLELLFAPLALVGRARPWLWGAMVSMQLGFLILIDVADLALGMIMVHLFTFDPDWVPAASTREGNARRALLFYDGHCALCHGIVQFVLAEDRRERVRFAPLQGATFEKAVPEKEVRASIPDSIVLRESDDGRLLVESDAALRLLTLLGGYWRLIGGLGRLVPRPVRDLAYRTLARYRRRWFGTTDDTCPLMPPELRDRFDLA